MSLDWLWNVLGISFDEDKKVEVVDSKSIGGVAEQYRINQSQLEINEHQSICNQTQIKINNEFRKRLNVLEGKK